MVQSPNSRSTRSQSRAGQGIHPLDDSFDFSQWAQLVRQQMIASIQKRNGQ
ncbi:MAG: hypothetical protein ACTS2F_00215 [Thainema sp.]